MIELLHKPTLLMNIVQRFISLKSNLKSNINTFKTLAVFTHLHSTCALFLVFFILLLHDFLMSKWGLFFKVSSAKNLAVCEQVNCRGNTPFGAAVTYLAIGVDGLGFDSRAGQVDYCCQRLTTALQFRCWPCAKPRRWAPPFATRFGVIPRV